MATATKKEEEAYPWKAGASCGHTTNLKQSILKTFDIYDLISGDLMLRIGWFGSWIKRECLQSQMTKDDQAKARLPRDEAQIYMNIYSWISINSLQWKYGRRI